MNFGAGTTPAAATTTQQPSATTTLQPASSDDASKAANQPNFQPNESLCDNNDFIFIEGIGRVPIAPAPITDAMRLNNGNANGLGLSYRHSRAYRHFKNPPQPHMCIRTTTDEGEELFINVLSWTRIVIPQEPSDPIPLYGGMRVPPGSPRSPPIVFAVMANPEVLKDSGRHSKDPEERRAMVELMCDFVEAMNPGVKLVRNAVILKDRDISGELKDVWNAVQAQRDREREEQIMQQRQQQHYHNVTTQQMFPKSTAAETQKTQEDENSTQKAREINEANATTTTSLSPAAARLPTQQLDNNKANNVMDVCGGGGAGGGVGENNNFAIKTSASAAGALNGVNQQMTMAPFTPNGQISFGALQQQQQQQQMQQQQQNGSCDQLDASVKDRNLKSPKEEARTNTTALGTSNASVRDKPQPQQQKQQQPQTTTNNTTKSPTSPTTPSVQTNTSTSSSKHNTKASAPTPATPAPAPTPAPTKKEKLGGFLPNGCIFPRFKNNKNKDKDKDKDKDKESKPKEKTLLNALKKSKDKKVAPIETAAAAAAAADKNTAEMDVKSQYEKNCINLESEVEKLDLNKIDSSTNNDNMFIKLKVATESAK